MSELAFVWACDLQESKKMTDDTKTKFTNCINSKIEEMLERHCLSSLICQFRGDGYLIAFKPNNIDEIILFAHDFCNAINADIEKGIVKDSFYLRTYLGCGKIDVSLISETDTESRSQGTGRFLDSFTGLVDNKFTDGLYLNENTSTCLVITDRVADYMEDIPITDCENITLNGASAKIKYYRVSNLIVSLYSDIQDEFKLDEAFDIIKAELNNKDVTVVAENTEPRKLILIGNEDEKSKIDPALDNAMKKLSKRGKNGWEGILAVAIDTKQREQIHDEELLERLKELKQNNKQDNLSSYLVWSDLSMDIFQKDHGSGATDSSVSGDFEKCSLNEKLRIYVKDYSAVLKKSSIDNKPIELFSALESECVYIHAFDYGALRLLEKISSKFDVEKYLRQQLEMGLILCDGVIIHSAELLRSKVVYEVLNEYKRFIEDGSIKLLFSSRVRNIEGQFEAYIQSKVDDYGMSEYGEIEATSLSAALKDTEHVKKTLELLLKCPKIIHRNSEGTRNLEDLIRSDLLPNQNVLALSKATLNSLEMLRCNYTLYQLLSAKLIQGEGLMPIITDECRENIISAIEGRLNGVISASIVNQIIEDNTPDAAKKYKGWYYSLVYRANLLYAMINTDKFIYMEYIPSLWKDSIFDYNAFISTFNQGISVDGYFGVETIEKIRANVKVWKEIRALYINSRSFDIYMTSTLKLRDRKESPEIKKAQELLEIVTK